MWEKINEIYEGDRELECYAYHLGATHPKYGQAIFVTENCHGTFDVEYYAYGGFCTIETLSTVKEAKAWVEDFVEKLKDWGWQDDAC